METMETQLKPDIKIFFKDGKLPTDVFVRQGTAYYDSLEGIPLSNAVKNNGKPPQISRIEDKAYVALEIAPDFEGEEDNSSFKVVGERGLYVRVICGKEEEHVNGETKIVNILKWIPYNSEDTKKYRYV